MMRTTYSENVLHMDRWDASALLRRLRSARNDRPVRKAVDATESSRDQRRKRPV